MKKENTVNYAMILAIILPFVIFGIFMFSQGKPAVSVYIDMIKTVITNKYGFCEVVIKWAPLLLTALAAIIPAKAGISNVGGEGQLIAGALGAAIAGIYVFDQTARIVGIPFVLLSGMLAGMLWAGVASFCKLKLKMNDTLTTMVLNYVMVDIACLMIYGPIKDTSGDNYPYSAPIDASLRFTTISGTRLNIGIVLTMIATILTTLFFYKTKKGLYTQLAGKNYRAAALSGLNVTKIQNRAFLCAGALAGLGGAILICGVEGRLRTTTGSNLGYLGFLAAGIAWNNTIIAIFTTFLISLLTVSGNAMEISSGLPSSTINILMTLVLLAVLCVGRRKKNADS